MKREEGREGGKEKGQIMQTARKAEESQGRGETAGRSGASRTNTTGEAEPCRPRRVKGQWPPRPSVTPCESDRLIKGGG